MSVTPAAPDIRNVVAEVYRRLQKVRPEAFSEPRVMLFVLTGEGGGEFSVIMGNGMVSVSRSAPRATPNVTVTMPLPEAVAIVTGTIEPVSAFFKGKIKIAGDMSHVVFLGTLLRAAGRVM